MRFIGGRPSSAHALLPDVLAPTYNGETSIAHHRSSTLREKYLVVLLTCGFEKQSQFVLILERISSYSICHSAH